MAAEHEQALVVGAHAVELHQQLIDKSTTGGPVRQVAALSPESIYLVKKQNARGVRPGELKLASRLGFPPIPREFRITLAACLRVHPAALKHGCTVEDISHAVDMALYDRIIDADNDPPKVLILGPDHAANILELVGRELAGDVLLIWHAMPCRPEYYSLLPAGGRA